MNATRPSRGGWSSICIAFMFAVFTGTAPVHVRGWQSVAPGQENII